MNETRPCRGILAVAAVLSAAGIALAPLASNGAAGAEELRHLLTLGHDRAPARYAPGSLDRTARAQDRFGLLAADFARWAGVKRAALPLQVLAPDDWAAAGASVPYGLAQIGPSGALLLPAWGDDASVRWWRERLGREVLPWPGGEPVRGTAQEAASLGLADLVAQLEAARALLSSAGFSAASPDLFDVWSAMMARAAFEQHEAHRLPELAEFFGRLAEGRPGAGGSTAAEAGVDSALRRWGWAYGVAAEAGGGAALKAFRATIRSALRTERRLLTGDFVQRFPHAREALARPLAAKAPAPPG